MVRKFWIVDVTTINIFNFRKTVTEMTPLERTSIFRACLDNDKK